MIRRGSGGHDLDGAEYCMVFMCCVGLYQIYEAYHVEFKKYLKRGVSGDGE